MQDIFLTETAEFADVVLPATSYLEKEGTYTNTDRRVQRGRKVLDSPGQAREDWRDHPGHRQPHRPGDGLRVAARGLRRAGRAHARLRRASATTTWARPASSIPTRIPSTPTARSCCSTSAFATDDGRAHLVPAEWMPAKELPERRVPVRAQHRTAARALAHRLDDPPLVCAGRHPARGALSTSTHATPTCWASPRATTCASPRGAAAIELRAQVSHRETPGTCFIPFHFREAAANLLTIDEIDPVGKIPEFKFCAVRIERIGPHRAGPTEAATVSEGVDGRRERRRGHARAGRAPGHGGAAPGSSPGRRLMPELNAIQREHGWLPREELAELSRDSAGRCTRSRD